MKINPEISMAGPEMSQTKLEQTVRTLRSQNFQDFLTNSIIKKFKLLNDL